jgi:thymidylate kinase
LSAEERQLLEARPKLLGLAAAAFRFAIKNALFHVAIAVEMSYRYVRHIALSRRPVVITDRYVYDLEFRQGKVPFVHGAWHRRIWYRLFPTPDGILYLTTPYDLVAERKPQLDREQFETMDRVFRRVLHPFHPLLVISDAPADAMARAFLTQHWETLLDRCNRRS